MRKSRRSNIPLEDWNPRGARKQRDRTFLQLSLRKFTPKQPQQKWAGVAAGPLELTSFRLKDKVHIQDLDEVGLITPEIEQTLREPLRARLAEVHDT
jgi:hypothetical protein